MNLDGYLAKPNDEANIKSQQFSRNTGLQAVFAMEEDSEGNIWFGDRDSGAWKYGGITLTNYTVDKKPKPQMILSISEGKDKTYYLE
ncbi:two-component regulator propeller domain-containing protein [Shivajiella indica]|uniref:Two-component regulator propeller domain-containing protein n=1 Tax=Shivajiella indica TaxID=872115 RepID=A0ABW5B621_9BACT